MGLLNIIPVIGAVVAILLGVFVIVSKQQSKSARITLALIVFLNAHNLIDSYLYYSDVEWSLGELSYLHYHLIGPLFLLYAYRVFRIELRVRLWVGIVLLMTLLRLVLLAPVSDDVLEVATTYTPDLIRVVIDNLLSILLNLGLLTLAFSKISHMTFVVSLSGSEKLNYRWLKTLLGLSIILYIAILISSVVSLFDEEWLIYFKIESVFNSIFSLSLVYCTMRFPIFSIHGDFKDLPEGIRKKYAKSSLTEVVANRLWSDIRQLMDEEKPYLNPAYRLNDLATSVDHSMHHVSQVINEKEDVSFSDFINKYRVEDAKRLLRSDRSRQVTILAISLEAGFNSKTAFYNTFKKITGQTPTQFIKETRN